MTTSPRWVWPGVLGWAAVIGASPWLLRWAWDSGPGSGPAQLEYTACAAASAFALGAALGRVRAWAPCGAAGALGALVMAAGSGAFDDTTTRFGDVPGFAVFVSLMLTPLVLLPLLTGALVGSLVGSLREG
ncbi:hypothetical protein [Kitasatospora sp. NPDC059571]|uniref:hypothetical protein n=1 Tax=Kitasatospora sp. NPDC059571 TaxID=3346871 RepID=UPI0036C2D37D